MNEIAIIALLFSLIFTELTGLLPGGIILPMYIVLYLNEPIKIVATIVSALIAIGILKILSRFAVIYGRRRFALFLVIGLLEKLIFTWFYYGNTYNVFNLTMTIGYLVPGILGMNMEKQGIWKTLTALFIVIFAIILLRVLFTGKMV